MKKIFLNGKSGSIIGNYALVDDEDFDRCDGYKWCASERRDGFMRVTGKVESTPACLHRFIMNSPKGTVVVFRDLDGFNCQKANLCYRTPKKKVAYDVLKHVKEGWKYRLVFNGVVYEGCKDTRKDALDEIESLKDRLQK